MGKKVFLSVVAIFFVSFFAFAEQEWDPAINTNQSLSVGDWIYRAGIVSGEYTGGQLSIDYKGLEEGKVVVEYTIKVSSEANSMAAPKVFKLPLNSKNQAFLNKGNSKSTLLLTVLDKSNSLKVEEIDYRSDVPVTPVIEAKVRSCLESRIKD